MSAAAPREKAIQPAPSALRLSLMNLKPIAQINIVVPANTMDIPSMATQYKTSKNCAIPSPPLAFFNEPLIHYYIVGIENVTAINNTMILKIILVIVNSSIAI